MTQGSHRLDLARIGERGFSEVLATFLSLPATPRTSSTPDSLPNTADQFAGKVLLTGKALTGAVQIMLPLPFLVRAVKHLTGLDGAEQEAVREDTAGEIANMVAGRVAAQIAAEGYPCTLGTPLVSRGVSFPVGTQPGEEFERIELVCDGHCLSLEIRCRYTAQ